jgi:adenine deaminase
MFHVEHIIKNYFMKIFGNLVDIHERRIYPAQVLFENGVILEVKETEKLFDCFILPGLIDAHVHIESSMVTPSRFAETAVKHGTVGVVSDPHEISNVSGLKGMEFMIRDAEKAPVYFWFGAPSCVPATDFETAGGILGPSEIEQLLDRKEIKYLSEMMNYPGVIYGDPVVKLKIQAAQRRGKKIDGHAPALRGNELKIYAEAGISTDHECSTMEEALEKISLGMKILIREGSAARNLEALKDLYKTFPGEIMLCSDDLHPEMLQKRHINALVSQLIGEGYNLFDVLRSCTINPVIHYGLEAGLLRPGDSADFILVDSPEKMNVAETWIKGNRVFGKDVVARKASMGETFNTFNCSRVDLRDIETVATADYMKIITVKDGELLTGSLSVKTERGKTVLSDVSSDILKIVVKDRYRDARPAVAFIKGFGLVKGAFASSIAHDSHNIICVGTDDSSITACINEIVRLKGGLAVSDGKETRSLELSIAGIMSDEAVETVAGKYEDLSDLAKQYGCILKAPFMTLSFMALLVIPELKLSDRGLFDGKKFSFTDLFTDN